MLNGLAIGRFLFRFRADEDGLLPRYKGSMLRGGFGYAFRGAVCHRQKADCGECSEKNSCPYSYIFETPSDRSDGVFSGYSDAPRPFVVEPMGLDRRRFAKGDGLDFGLLLIGKSIDYLPYFIFCFEKLGRLGLGRGRIRFSLEEVCGLNFNAGDWALLYSGRERFLRDTVPTIDAHRLEQDCGGTLTLNFLTPTRIKYRGKYVTDLEFHVLMRSLLRRTSMMALYHCDSELKADVTALIAEAKMVEVQSWDLKWQDLERYSSRKKAIMKMGGVVGSVTYRGDFGKFMPFISLGEQIHVGKNTTFGLGRYQIRREGSVP